MYHTPAPWKVKGKSGTFSVNGRPHGMLCAIRFLGNDKSRLAEEKANAQLMAKAPELLAMLEKLCEHSRLLLTRAGVAGCRETADGSWVRDPASQAFVEARELLERVKGGA